MVMIQVTTHWFARRAQVRMPGSVLESKGGSILASAEVIRDVNENPSLRKVSAETLVRNVIHEDGGPLIHNGWEDEQRTFDSTCRKFYRFLAQPQR